MKFAQQAALRLLFVHSFVRLSMLPVLAPNSRRRTKIAIGVDVFSHKSTRRGNNFQFKSSKVKFSGHENVKKLSHIWVHRGHGLGADCERGLPCMAIAAQGYTPFTRSSKHQAGLMEPRLWLICRPRPSSQLITCYIGLPITTRPPS